MKGNGRGGPGHETTNGTVKIDRIDGHTGSRGSITVVRLTNGKEDIYPVSHYDFSFCIDDDI